MIRSSGQVKTSSEQTMKLARLPDERAHIRLPLRGEDVPRGEEAHGFLPRHSLFGLPAGSSPVRGRDGSVDAVRRIRALHREVRAVGDDHARVDQGAPGAFDGRLSA